MHYNKTHFIFLTIIILGARRDEQGYFWITGRMDDMLNVSGHLLSTAEVESAFVEHPACVEAAVVSLPHPLKGECLYSFIVLSDVSASAFCTNAFIF